MKVDKIEKKFPDNKFPMKKKKGFGKKKVSPKKKIPPMMMKQMGAVNSQYFGK
jgi:hypothetical protein